MVKAVSFYSVIRVAALGFLFLACQAGQQPQKTPSKAEVKAAIEDYVIKDIDLRGAFFLQDPRDGSVLALSFDHVHEGVHATEDKKVYACVDFKDAAGNIYDVDVYMAQTGGDYRPSKLIVHKVNGEVVAQK